MSVQEKPIIFSGAMVRAIIEDRKTMTRRVVKAPGGGLEWDMTGANGEITVDPGGSLWGPGPYLKVPFRHPADRWEGLRGRVHCPYGYPEEGQRFWVRESMLFDPDRGWRYSADGADVREDADYWKRTPRCPSIHMPRLASRITLALTSVKVERVQDITEDDAKAEGISPWVNAAGEESPMAWRDYSRSAAVGHCCPRESFRTLWDSINGKRPGCAWEDNPWVWALSFRKVTP